MVGLAYQTMSDAVAVAIRRRGISQERFAKEVLDMSEQTLRSRMNGFTEWTLGEAEVLANEVGWPLDVLADRKSIG